jgi:enhancer of polycomb-like protein
MSRLSFRPRPLDIHKKLPILKSVREFEDEEPGIAPLSSARAGVLLRHSGADFTASGANNATEGEVFWSCCLSLNFINVKCWCL